MSRAVEVAVPSDVFAGDAFLIDHGGQQLTVICPEGCGPGFTLQVEIPAPVSRVEVVIPDGLSAGDDFLIDFDGEKFTVLVPIDNCAGDLITIEVPPAPAVLPTPTPDFNVKPESPNGLAGPSAVPAPAPAKSRTALTPEWAPTPSIFSMGPPPSLNGEPAGACRPYLPF